MSGEAPSYSKRLATGGMVATLGALAFGWLAMQLRDSGNLLAFDLAFADALARALPPAVVQAAARLSRLGDPATLGVLGVVVGVVVCCCAGKLGLDAGDGPCTRWQRAAQSGFEADFFAHASVAGGPGGIGRGLQLSQRSQLGHGRGVRHARLPRAAPATTGALASCGASAMPALGVGLSRIILRVHYASDVAAGFASGTTWLAVCITGIELGRWLRHRGRRS